MAQEFVGMVKMLIQDAETYICLKGTTNVFKIGRGVKQGCPLAPYLFILAREVLIYMMKITKELGDVRGINLPKGNIQRRSIHDFQCESPRNAQIMFMMCWGLVESKP